MRSSGFLIYIVTLQLISAPASSEPAWAQAVRGHLVEEGTETPIDGAFILLLDKNGREVARALSDERGHFSVQAPAPGLYTLRADRIGYQSTHSPLLELGPFATREYRLAAPVVAVQLAGLTVEAERRCLLRPEEGLETARVWEEARKALAAARWTDEQRLFSFRLHRYTRVLDPNTLVIQEERSDSTWRAGGAPFVTPAVDDLVANGFVQRTPAGQAYYAPDAEVLLSDAFLDTHCFGLQSAERETGLIGLTFKPVGGRDVTDVEGVLWLDEASAELRHVEYRYAGLRLSRHMEAMQSRFGGRLEFERLPTGAWIIRRWWIRGPIREPGGGYTSSAVQEEGGEVVRILARVGGRSSPY